MKSLTLLFCLGLTAVATHAASNCPMVPFPAAYSVETETTAGGNKTAMKLFVDGDKMRTEMDAGGMQMISIMRKDKKMSYSLMPAQKMVMENPIPDAPATAAAAGPEPVWEKVGSSTVNGQACTEYKVKSGADTMSYFLNADKLLVRMANASMTMDYKNYKAGAQDAALFEIPAGYSKPGEAPAPAASSSDSSGSGATADNASSSDSLAPAAAPEKPAKKKKLGMLGR
ncbi:MAG: DUF4412 domain-containing protein [Opitutaceae bacterium]|nr:DUF4412 domain-containing protein [Opitutaceae bacterium]